MYINIYIIMQTPDSAREARAIMWQLTISYVHMYIDIYIYVYNSNGLSYYFKLDLSAQRFKLNDNNNIQSILGYVTHLSKIS